jgi:hypothetical protein
MSETKKEVKKVSLVLNIILISVALIIGFGIGILVQRSHSPFSQTRAKNGQFQMGDRDSNSKTIGNNQGSLNGGPSGQNNASGEVTKIDDSSITIKTPNGGSKLIMISDSTTYKQLADSDKSKLQVGSQVIIDGESNSDGSITGKTISIN